VESGERGTRHIVVGMEECSPCFQLFSFPIRYAPPPAPPPPTGPATPPQNARQRVALLMETVPQDLVFAVSYSSSNLYVFKMTPSGLVTTSTCSSTISTNTTYIQNPGYPSSYTPTATGTCVYTINKISDDICQLRLDFQTMSGFAETAGACSDSFASAGQTGKNPPTICGTNTGYHMYTEFGATSTDTVGLTVTYGSTTTAKTWNILTRQIACTANWKAPLDCTQYFTGSAGSVKSYNFAGGQLLQSQYYDNCIRTESGYCGIQWKESSTSSPDPFQMTVTPSTNGAAGSPPSTCPASFIYIPNLSPDGISALPVPPSTQEFYSTMCGGAFAIEGTAIPLALVCKFHTIIIAFLKH